MSILVISNPTVIDRNAFHLIGACTKRGDSSAIGYFGSGLKYAIAVLLREGIEFHVYSGGEEIMVTARPETFRGQRFSVIHIDGQKTSLTTEMGPDWQVWQAVREIVCNAIDEGDDSITVCDSWGSDDSGTSFQIDCGGEKMADLILNWDRCFSQNRVCLASCPSGDVYPRMSSHVNIYRKGVRCYDQKVESLYDYDFPYIDINESRIIAHEHEMKNKISDIWKQCATVEMLDNLCANISGDRFLESGTVWFWCDNTSVPFGPQWHGYFENKLMIPRSLAGWFTDDCNRPNSVILPKELINRLKIQWPDLKAATDSVNERHRYRVVPMTESESFRLKKAMQFFDEVKLTIGYPVQVAQFEDSKIMGRAHDGAVILSKKLFDHGVRAVALTVLEEIAHLESEKPDESRAFQNYLLSQILTLLENQHGIFL